MDLNKLWLDTSTIDSTEQPSFVRWLTGTLLATLVDTAVNVGVTLQVDNRNDISGFDARTLPLFLPNA